MIVSMETYLLRGKRQLDKWALRPGVRTSWRLILYGSGGFLFSAAPLWNHMQPFAAGLVCGSSGIWSGAAAAGAVFGYRLIWGSPGFQGVAWTLSALVLGLALRRWADPERKTELLTAGNALIAAVTGLAFQLRFGDPAPLSIYLLRIFVAAGSACLISRLTETRSRMATWTTCAVGILGLAGLSGVPWLNLGCLAAGALAAAAPLSAAALAGIGLEAAGLRCMTAGLCISCFLRLAPIRDRWRRMFAPSMGCLAAMALGQYWNPGALLGITLGALAGAAIPWHWAALHRPSGTGAIQVRLEQSARLLLQLQQMLLETPSPPIDEDAIVDQLRINACGECSCRSSCREQQKLTRTILSEPFSFDCRKNGRLLRELRRSQDQIRSLKAQRAKQREFRSAAAQQYGFLSGYLQLLADRLPLRERRGAAHFHIQVSARSSSRETANGDSCIAFPGMGYRYFILLCDGMGTGLGAAEEGRQAAELIRQMLTSGLPPQFALGSINTHLALRGQAGAVTVDLAEVRLDTGRAAIYKWGAAPSLFLRRNHAEKIGTVTPPPGLSATEHQESVVRLSLRRGEVLVLTSDGIHLDDTSGLAELAGQLAPGELAKHILQTYGSSGEDDATAAVIRLRPVNLAT